MRKIILWCLSLSFFTMSMVGISHALVVTVPTQQGQEDLVVNGPTQVQWDEWNVFSTIQLINKYLWFAISVVCMGVLIYGGFLLMTANGDDKKMQTANKILTGALIGIVIAILSYAIVRIVVNLLW